MLSIESVKIGKLSERGKKMNEKLKRIINDGVGVELTSKEEAIEILTELAVMMSPKNKFNPSEVYDKAIINGKCPQWLFVSTFEDMGEKTFLLAMPTVQKITKKDGTFLGNGVLCRVYNTLHPSCSEIGDCFFAKGYKGIKRMG